MTVRFAYDERWHPPAPVLPVRIGGPGQAPVILLGFLVDSGADLSVVPEAVARGLRLPAVSQVSVKGVGGTLRRVRVYAAEIEAGGLRTLVEVIGLGEDALIGRDVLNRWITILRGPEQVLEVSVASEG